MHPRWAAHWRPPTLFLYGLRLQLVRAKLELLRLFRSEQPASPEGSVSRSSWIAPFLRRSVLPSSAASRAALPSSARLVPSCREVISFRAIKCRCISGQLRSRSLRLARRAYRLRPRWAASCPSPSSLGPAGHRAQMWAPWKSASTWPILGTTERFRNLMKLFFALFLKVFHDVISGCRFRKAGGDTKRSPPA